MPPATVFRPFRACYGTIQNSLSEQRSASNLSRPICPALCPECYVSCERERERRSNSRSRSFIGASDNLSLRSGQQSCSQNNRIDSQAPAEDLPPGPRCGTSLNLAYAPATQVEIRADYSGEKRKEISAVDAGSAGRLARLIPSQRNPLLLLRTRICYQADFCLTFGNRRAAGCLSIDELDKFRIGVMLEEVSLCLKLF